jgi:hypothetical protein
MRLSVIHGHIYARWPAENGRQSRLAAPHRWSLRDSAPRPRRGAASACGTARATPRCRGCRRMSGGLAAMAVSCSGAPPRRGCRRAALALSSCAAAARRLINGAGGSCRPLHPGHAWRAPPCARSRRAHARASGPRAAAPHGMRSGCRSVLAFPSHACALPAPGSRPERSPDLKAGGRGLLAAQRRGGRRRPIPAAPLRPPAAASGCGLCRRRLRRQRSRRPLEPGRQRLFFGGS